MTFAHAMVFAFLSIMSTLVAVDERPIETGDIIHVSVKDLADVNVRTELNRRVDEHGIVTIPGMRPATTSGHLEIQMAGRSLEEAVDVINETYRTAELLQNAEARVTIVARSASVKVQPGPARVGDALEIYLWGLEGPNAESRLNRVVDKEGKIELPRIKPLVVKGLTESQIEDAITKAYHDANLIATMMVAVMRIDPREASTLPATQTSK